MEPDAPATPRPTDEEIEAAGGAKRDRRKRISMINHPLPRPRRLKRLSESTVADRKKPHATNERKGAKKRIKYRKRDFRLLFKREDRVLGPGYYTPHSARRAIPATKMVANDPVIIVPTHPSSPANILDPAQSHLPSSSRIPARQRAPRPPPSAKEIIHRILKVPPSERALHDIEKASNQQQGARGLKKRSTAVVFSESNKAKKGGISTPGPKMEGNHPASSLNQRLKEERTISALAELERVNSDVVYVPPGLADEMAPTSFNSRVAARMRQLKPATSSKFKPPQKLRLQTAATIFIDTSGYGSGFGEGVSSTRFAECPMIPRGFAGIGERLGVGANVKKNISTQGTLTPSTLRKRMRNRARGLKKKASAVASRAMNIERKRERKRETSARKKQIALKSASKARKTPLGKRTPDGRRLRWMIACATILRIRFWGAAAIRRQEYRRQVKAAVKIQKMLYRYRLRRAFRRIQIVKRFINRLVNRRRITKILKPRIASKSIAAHRISSFLLFSFPRRQSLRVIETGRRVRRRILIIQRAYRRFRIRKIWHVAIIVMQQWAFQWSLARLHTKEDLVVAKSQAEVEEIQNQRHTELKESGELEKADSNMWYMATCWWLGILRKECERMGKYELMVKQWESDVDQGFEVEELPPRPTTPCFLSTKKLRANAHAVQGMTSSWQEIARLHHSAMGINENMQT